MHFMPNHINISVDATQNRSTFKQIMIVFPKMWSAHWGGSPWHFAHGTRVQRGWWDLRSAGGVERRRDPFGVSTGSVMFCFFSIKYGDLMWFNGDLMAWTWFTNNNMWLYNYRHCMFVYLGFCISSSMIKQSNQRDLTVPMNKADSIVKSWDLIRISLFAQKWGTPESDWVTILHYLSYL